MILNGNDHETVPTRVYRVIDRLIKPYFKEEDWEDLEPRIHEALDDIFQDAAELELKNELGFIGMVARMDNKILSNRTYIFINLVVTVVLFILLLIWT